MKKIAIVCFLTAIGLSSGCRLGALGKSVAKNQGDIVESVVYSDSLVTDDGTSVLTRPE